MRNFGDENRLTVGLTLARKILLRWELRGGSRIDVAMRGTLSTLGNGVCKHVIEKLVKCFYIHPYFRYSCEIATFYRSFFFWPTKIDVNIEISQKSNESLSKF